MATIHDVARLAGVSSVTVSRVLNNSDRVSEPTRARIQEAIEELGYVPSVAARSLRSRQTFTLALIVPDISNAFWTTVARGVEDAARGKGYSVFLCNTDESPAKQASYLDVVISQQVDGVIIAPYDADAGNLEKLRRRKIPVVVVDRNIEGWEVDSVSGDSVAGARALVRHLISLGHRRIAVITGSTQTSTAVDRVVGYQLALDEAGIAVDPALVRFGEFRASSGGAETNELLDLPDPPTAIFAANNAIAMGVIDAVAARGLRIPHDVALVSFDDLPRTSHFFPFLTVAVQPVYELGVNAAQLLLSRLAEDESLPARQVVLPTRLVVRHSCGSKLSGSGGASLSLPLVVNSGESISIAPRVAASEAAAGRASLERLGLFPTRGVAWSDVPQPDAVRLLAALRRQPTGRIPYLEMWIDSPALYMHLLGRPAQADRLTGRPVTPEDHVELAGLLGMDAVVCDFARPVGGDAAGSGYDHDQPASPLLDQLNYLERYLRAVQGTGVGVIVHFSGLLGETPSAARATAQLVLDDRGQAERQLDAVLQKQLLRLQTVCDRFADDITAVLISDYLCGPDGPWLEPDLLESVYSKRACRLIAPARDHQMLAGIHVPGRVEAIMALLHAAGFNFVHPIDPAYNDLAALHGQWGARMALAGGFPGDLLRSGPESAIQDLAHDLCGRLGGGLVVGSAIRITDEVPRQHVIALARAVRSCRIA